MELDPLISQLVRYAGRDVAMCVFGNHNTDLPGRKQDVIRLATALSKTFNLSENRLAIQGAPQMAVDKELL